MLTHRFLSCSGIIILGKFMFNCTRGISLRVMFSPFTFKRKILEMKIFPTFFSNYPISVLCFPHSSFISYLQRSQIPSLETLRFRLREYACQETISEFVVQTILNSVLLRVFNFHFSLSALNCLSYLLYYRLFTLRTLLFSD